MRMENRLPIKELIWLIQEEIGYRCTMKEIREVLDALSAVVKKQVKQGRSVGIPKFGKFAKRHTRTTKGEGYSISFKCSSVAKWK
jgi:nucleoid DNA-binding protein